MEERTFAWGITAGVFILLLAFSSWHGAWWRSKASSTNHTRSYQVTLAPSNPFAPTSEFVPLPSSEFAPAPKVAASPVFKQPIQPIPEEMDPGFVVPYAPEGERELEENETQSEDTIPQVDFEGLIERNRGHEHASRTH